jgi:hypothetical protein
MIHRPILAAPRLSIYQILRLIVKAGLSTARAALSIPHFRMEIARDRSITGTILIIQKP